MTNYAVLGLTAALVTFGTATLAQQGMTSLNNTDPSKERFDSIVEQTQDQFKRSQDAERYGRSGRREGLHGNVYGSAVLNTGNTDTSSLSLGVKMTHGAGVWGQEFSLGYEYGKTGDTTSKDKYFALYDVTRDFSDRLYGYGLLRTEGDKLADTSDSFAGFGVGYRIFNDRDFAWRVQAGPGYRIKEASLSSFKADEAGVAASSRLYYRISSSAYLTNDTDIIWSDASTLMTNDLGATMSLAGPISLRLGFKTSHDSVVPTSLKGTNSTTSVAVIYGF